ncbi:ABC transporter permease [Cohnella caldifontis]|uniref:ABC transporter permease n=1 Tax=Cohnella caldifontis TaxID=3027471 RepID=UPI0023ED8C4D|nr:ABC transporter permease [Cohnella sp. YIM B05605]
MRSLNRTGNVVLGIAVLIAVWQLIVAIGKYDVSLLPPPLLVAEGIAELVKNGTLAQHMGISLMRFAAGYLSACAAAVTAGLALGQLPRVWRLFDPIVQLIRPVSPIAWSPFIVLWFGIGNAPAIVIIFLAAFFPVLLSTVSGMRKVDPTHAKVARNLEMGRMAFLTKIVLPSAFPTIANGLHIAIGTSWIFLVSGEMVGSQSGLGYLIVDSRNTLRLDLVLAGIICIGLFGLLLDRLVGLLETWVGKHWGIVRQ